MKNSRLWLVPLCFFIVCCALNLIGSFISPVLKSTVKPALMPLLCVTTFCWLLPRLGMTDQVGHNGSVLLVSAQLLGFAGDTLLIPDGFVFFAGGIAMFLFGHVCYISLFGGRSFKGLKPWQWVVGLVSAVAVTVILLVAIGVKGTMLAPMGIYALALSMLIFSTLAGALRFGGCTWWTLACGALLFTFSDSLIAINTFHGVSPFLSGFGVMSTYLLAQSLLAIGACRLLTGRR